MVQQHIHRTHRHRFLNSQAGTHWKRAKIILCNERVRSVLENTLDLKCDIKINKVLIQQEDSNNCKHLDTQIPKAAGHRNIPP